MLALFRAKFACNLAISNPVFRWESCKSSVWESVKKCSRLCKVARTRDWDSQVAHEWQAARGCTRVKHFEKMNSHASWTLQDKKSSLAILLARNLNSRISQIARPSYQPALFWKTWLFAFRSLSSINTPHTHEILRASKENIKRETLEKK